MRKELIIGILVSAILHASFLFGSYLFPERKVVVKHDTDSEDLIQMVLPPIEPDPEDTVEEIQDEQPLNQLAPPSLVDMPTVVPVDAFVQQMQPPPPPGLEPNKGAVSIPVTKPGTNFGKGMKDLFNIADLDQIPVARVQMKPNYPYDMMRERLEGEAVVAFIVTSTGDVVDAYAVSSSRREFERPAVEAVMRWKFRPGRKGGRAVNTKVQQMIKFTLED